MMDYSKLQNGSDVRGVASDMLGKEVNLTVSAADDIAYGFGAWYGETEMFGEEGVYQRLVFDGGSDVITLKKKYTYTVTLRSASNGNVGTSGESMDTF